MFGLQLVVLFEKVMKPVEVQCCWRKYITRDRLWGCTAFPHFLLVLLASCVLLKCNLSALCSCHHILPSIVGIYPSGTLRQRNFFKVAFGSGILSQQRKSNQYSISWANPQMQQKYNWLYHIITYPAQSSGRVALTKIIGAKGRERVTRTPYGRQLKQESKVAF